MEMNTGRVRNFLFETLGNIEVLWLPDLAQRRPNLKRLGKRRWHQSLENEQHEVQCCAGSCQLPLAVLTGQYGMDF